MIRETVRFSASDEEMFQNRKKMRRAGKPSP
jgi:hypothetical protein